MKVSTQHILNKHSSPNRVTRKLNHENDFFKDDSSMYNNVDTRENPMDNLLKEKPKGSAALKKIPSPMKNPQPNYQNFATFAETFVRNNSAIDNKLSSKEPQCIQLPNDSSLTLDNSSIKMPKISNFQIFPSSQDDFQFLEYSFQNCPTTKNPTPKVHKERKPMFQCYVCQAIFGENSYRKKYDAGVFNEKQRFQCNRCWGRAKIFIDHTPAPPLDTPTPFFDTPAPLFATPATLLDTPTPLLDIPAPLLDTPESILDTPAPLLDTLAPLLDTLVPLFDTPVLNLAPNLAPTPALLVYHVPDRFCDIRRRGD